MLSCLPLLIFLVSEESRIFTFYFDIFQVLTAGLVLSETEAQGLLYQIEAYRDICGLDVDVRRVRFSDNGPMNLSAFLGCFDCHTHRSEGDSSHVGATMTVKSSLSDEKCSVLGKKRISVNVTEAGLADT